jgi:hypothetical protein
MSFVPSSEMRKWEVALGRYNDATWYKTPFQGSSGMDEGFPLLVLVQGIITVGDVWVGLRSQSSP